MMLTLAQLDAWAAFGGDPDGWARSAQRAADPDAGRHWPVIDELVTGLTLVREGVASPAYAEALRARIATLAPDPAVRDRLYSLAAAPRSA